MRPSSRPLVLVLACAIAGLVLTQSAPAAVSPQSAPVPSLEPQATQELWLELVRQKTFRPYAVAADCRPLRAVFYAATDWLRLATKLAAAASPCAQYYVSVPPVVADKTKPRPDQAGRIRALGPNVHALAEIHYLLVALVNRAHHNAVNSAAVLFVDDHVLCSIDELAR